MREASPAGGAGRRRPDAPLKTDVAGNPRLDSGEKTDIGAYAASAKAVVPLITDEEWRARSKGNPDWKLTRIAPQ